MPAQLCNGQAPELAFNVNNVCVYAMQSSPNCISISLLTWFVQVRNQHQSGLIRICVHGRSRAEASSSTAATTRNRNMQRNKKPRTYSTTTRINKQMHKNQGKWQIFYLEIPPSQCIYIRSKMKNLKKRRNKPEANESSFNKIELSNKYFIRLLFHNSIPSVAQLHYHSWARGQP